MDGYCASASSVFFLLSFCLSAFVAAAAGGGGRGPFYFAGASGPAFLIPPLLAAVQFCPLWGGAF